MLRSPSSVPTERPPPRAVGRFSQTADGDYITAGFMYSYGEGADDVYLIKTVAWGQMTGIEGEETPPLPTHVALGQNYPNPFNPGTTITIELPEGIAADVPVTLCVFDVQGRLVRNLWKGTGAKGIKSVTWDGKGNRGEPLSSGIYLYELCYGEDKIIRKTTLVK